MGGTGNHHAGEISQTEKDKDQFLSYAESRPKKKKMMSIK
jgi:hypothetical protein